MPDESPRLNIISTNTLVPLGIVVATILFVAFTIGVPLIRAVWSAADTWSELRHELTELKRAVQNDAWTYDMERQVWEEFAKANSWRGATIPDIKSIHDDKLHR